MTVERPLFGFDDREYDRRDREGRKRQSEAVGTGFPCPKCNERARVIDSRRSEKTIRRRRVCDICGERFSTTEAVAVEGAHTNLGQDEIKRYAKRLVIKMLAAMTVETPTAPPPAEEEPDAERD